MTVWYLITRCDTRRNRPTLTVSTELAEENLTKVREVQKHNRLVLTYSFAYCTNAFDIIAKFNRKRRMMNPQRKDPSLSLKFNN